MEFHAVVLLALVASAFAGPIAYRGADDSTSCAKQCTGTSKFRFQPGTTYVYDYDVKTVTTMENAYSASAVLLLSATAELEVLSKCEMALSLRNTKLQTYDSAGRMVEASNQRELRRALEGRPLRFAYQDGVLEGLCPAEGEDKWALNVKRGVLSALQNSMDDLSQPKAVKEDDVAGRCPVQYSPAGAGWYSNSVKKSKDLLACTDRNGLRSALQATPYRVPSEVQSLPLLKSSHECTQDIDKSAGFVRQTVCKERHVFRPFSRQGSGAATTVDQTLKFQSTRPGVRTSQDAVGRRASLYYEHAYAPGQSQDGVREAEAKLGQLCRSTKADIRPETPRLFAQLVSVLQALDVAALRDLYAKAKTSAVCGANVDRTKKFFLDAVPMTQTAAGVQLMTELLVNKEVTGLDADLYVTSLALIQHPSKEMLQQVKALVESRDLSEKALLPVTTLVSAYCQDRDCDSDPAVGAIMEALQRIIGSSCYVSDKHLDKILLALRAAGNAGHYTSITPTLTRCLTRRSNPLEIRVAAIDAFRRQPCSADRSQLVSSFQDEKEDHELRIAAYLGAMGCPSQELLETVRQVLQTEGINQVTSFVWTHLSNLKETSSPHKQALRSLVEDARLKEEFSLAALKYSRNLEGSFFFEKVNMGAMAESNVIWSQDSYPRSAMVNLTVDLFGSSVNLLEVGGRLEGLDMLLESYLGPYGYFGDKSNKGSKKKLEDVSGSAYLRLFGNEMAFGHFKGMEGATSGSKFNMLEFLIDLSKDHDYRFSQSAVFMDTTLTVPTAGGLPLHLTVNGSASVDMAASGKLDLRKVATSPRSLTVDGSLQPSGAVEITSTMSVDGGVTSSGLRMVSTLHSSTALNGRIELQRGKVLKVEWDVPQEKMELLDVKTTFFTLHGDEEKEQDLITDNRKSIKLCSGAKLAKVSGLELCAEVSFPNASMKNDAPYFPFTGPVSASLSLFKRDSHSSYKLIAKRNENNYASMAQLAFDTPGSAVDRALSFDVSLNYKKKEFDLSLLSPWTKVIFASAVTSERREKALAGKLTVDDKREYSVKAQLTQSSAKNSDDVWSPLVEIKAPSITPVALTGSVLVRKAQRLEVDLTLAGATDSPLNLKSTVINSDSEKSIDAVYNGGKGDYSVLASVDMQGKGKKGSARLNVKTPRRELVSFQGKGDHRPGKSFKGDVKLEVPDLLSKPISLNSNVRLLARGKGNRYQGQLQAVSQFASGKLYGFVFTRNNGVQSRMTLDYQVPRVARDKVTLSGKFNDKSTKSLIKYLTTANIAFKRNPDYNLVTNADFSHSKRHTEAGASLVFGKNAKTKVDRFDINASLKRKGTVTLRSADVNFRAAMTYPPKGWNVQLKGSHEHDKSKVASGLNLKYGKDKEASLALNLKDASKKLTKLTGSLKTSCPGGKMSLSSTLSQRNKRVYEHVLNLNWNKTSHGIKTTLKRDPRGGYSVDTDLRREGLKPISASASSNLQLRSHKGDLALAYGGDKYQVKTSHKLARGTGKLDLELVHPDRRVTFAMEGGKDGKKYSGSMNADWDADRKKSSSRVKLDGSASLESLQDMSANAALSYPDRDLTLNLQHKKKGATYNSHGDVAWGKKDQIVLDITLLPEANKVSGDVALTTPFKGWAKMAAGVLVSEEKERYLGEAMASLGNRKLKTSLALLKPVSLNQLTATWEASTPFYGWRSLGASLKHSLDGKLATELKGSLGRDTAELTLAANNRGDFWTRRDADVSATFKSSIKGWEELAASARHQDDGNRWSCAYQLTRNGDPYSLNLDLSAYRQGWQVESNGQAILIVPDDRMMVNWQHRNTANRMLTDVTANVGQGRVIRLNTAGEHSVTPAARKLSGSVSLQSPWKVAEDVAFAFDHQHGPGMVRSTSTLKSQSREVASSLVSLNAGPGHLDLDVTVTHPYSRDDVTGKVTARYGESPMNAHAELQWSRRGKVALDGSVESGLPFSATMRLTSPWQHADNVLAAVSHKEEKGQYVSALRLDYGIGKTIEAKSTLGLGDHKMAAVHVTTPFEQLRLVDASGEVVGDLTSVLAKASLTAEPALGRYSSELTWKLAQDKLDAKARLDTPIRGFKYGQVVIAAQGAPLSGSGRVEIDYDNHQVISLTSSHNFDQDADLEVTLMTPYQGYEFLNAKMDNDLARSGLTSHAEFSYERYKKVEADLQSGWERDYSASLTVRTPFRGHEQSSALFRHSGSLEDFATHAETRAMGHSMEADASFKYGWTSKAGATLKTSFPGWESVAFSGESTGRWENMRSAAALEYGRGQRVEGDVQFKFNLGKRVKAVLGVKAPFLQDLDLSLEQHGSPVDFSYKMASSYGRDYELTDEMTFTLSKVILVKNDMSVKCPSSGQHTYNVFFRHEGGLDSMSTQGSLSKDDQEVKMTSTLQTTPSIKGELSVQTPFEGYRILGLDFQHSGGLEDFSSQGAVRYTENQVVSGKASFSHQGLQQINGQVEVITEIPGYVETKVVFSQNGAWNDFKSHLEASCGKAHLNADANFQHADQKTTGAVILTSFFPALRNMKLTFDREGGVDRMRSSGLLQLNGEELVSGVLTHRQTEYLVASTLNLSNKYTEPLSLATDYDSTPSRHSLKASASLGSDYSVESDSSIVLDLPQITATSSLAYKVGGEDDVGSLTFKKEGEWDDVKMSAKASKGDKECVMDISFQNTDKVAGEVAISTPVAPYRSLGASFQHSGPADNFNSEARLRYRDGEEMVLGGRFYQNQWRRVDASAQLTTPFRDLEMTKVEYTHTGDSRGFKCQGKAEYSQGQAVSGDLRLSYEPKVDFDLKVKTPFQGFEDMSASASYDAQRMRYGLDGRLAIGSDAVAAKGELDYSDSPMTASLLLTTPFDNFDLTQVKVSHQGEPGNFRSSADFQTPLTDAISGQVAFRFESPTDLDVSTQLSSKLPGMESLKLATRAFESGPVYNHHIEIGWTPEDEIALDTTYRKDAQWYQTDRLATLALATPFPQLKSAQVSGKHLTAGSKIQQEFSAQWNGQSIFDADWTYDKKDQHEVSMNMRQPRAMQVAASGSAGDVVNGDILLNWNRNDPESNVRVTVDYNNKDADSQTERDWSLKLVHPARTLGLEGSFLSSPAQLKSTGALILHERDDQKVWYELESSDSSSYYSTMKDASLKVGTPWRVLQAQGSKATQSQTTTLQGALLWDAERSQDKQVGGKLVLTPSGRSHKADITLTLPSISKEFEIGSEVTVNQGRTLFNSKTEFSYSRDARKTLVLTSSLENISRGYGSSNYSLSLGLAHAQTDINVQVKGHAGMDNEKVTGGLDLQYLTAARQTKTLFLLGEIDKLRRQISVMMDSPLQQLEASGRLESLEPFKVKVEGRQSGLPFSASAMVDPSQKLAVLRTTYDLDNPDNVLELQASFYNDTFLQAKATRQVRGYPIKDAEVFVALTTPQLITSKATWRPTILQDIEGFLGDKLRSNAGAMLKAIDSLSEAAKAELQGKYTVVSRAVKEELYDLAKLLDQEMTDVSRELTRAQRQLRRMYNRNAFHLKDMGDVAEQAFRKVYDGLKTTADSYDNLHKEVMAALSKFLDDVTKVPVGPMYDEFVQRTADWLKSALLSSLRTLEKRVASLDESVTALKNRYSDLRQNLDTTITEQMEALKTHPLVERMRNSLPDYEAYVDAAHQQLQQLSIPEQYTGAIYGARDLINSGLSQIIDSQDLRNIQEAGNEVYQQAVWAYQYWQVEENIKEHIKSILRAVEDIVRDELKQHSQWLAFLKHCKVVSYKPGQGLVEVQVGLPLPMADLHSPPDPSQLLQDLEALADKYLPSKQTLQHVYDKYVPKTWFASNKTTPIPEDDMDTQLQDYLNAPERRRNRPAVRSL